MSQLRVSPIPDLIAQTPTIPEGTPWWVAAVLVLAPVVATVLVARAPVWLERVKQRGAKEAPPAATSPTSPVVEAPPEKRADAALDLIERSLRDAWAERDAANRRADRLQAELDAEQEKVARLLIERAELRARCADPSREGAHGER